jgi:hypothetical protein
MSDDDFRAWLENENGYLFVRKLDDGTWVGLTRMIYTWGLCVGLSQGDGYERRYCYEDQLLAINEIQRMKSSEDIPSGWIARRPALYG